MDARGGFIRQASFGKFGVGKLLIPIIEDQIYLQIYPTSEMTMALKMNTIVNSKCSEGRKINTTTIRSNNNIPVVNRGLIQDIPISLNIIHSKTIHMVTTTNINHHQIDNLDLTEEITVMVHRHSHRVMVNNNNTLPYRVILLYIKKTMNRKWI